MTKIYKVDGLDCQVCAYSIEMELQNEGIKCKCSYPKETLEVLEEIDKKKEKKIKKVVRDYGFELIELIN